ncbi:MAG TPA: hypothetical protein VGM21_01535 [Actinomycetota bacterium]|jgi:hypothetical protein
MGAPAPLIKPLLVALAYEVLVDEGDPWPTADRPAWSLWPVGLQARQTGPTAMRCR